VVVGEAEDGRVAAETAMALSPDLILMDIAMPNLSGIESTRQIRTGQVNGDGPKVIVLAANCQPRVMSEVFGAGAAGYVLKTSAFAELVIAVNRVMANKVYLSPTLNRTMDSECVERGLRGQRSRRGSGRSCNSSLMESPRSRSPGSFRSATRLSKLTAAISWTS
jgi:DNA-binding NarL/FixJ family response regulator